VQEDSSLCLQKAQINIQFCTRWRILLSATLPSHNLMRGRMTSLLLLLAACMISNTLPCSASGASSATGSYSVQLTPNITLRYTLNSDSSVLFDVQAVLSADTAYFGLGLSELGSMKGADMAIFHNTQLSKGAATTPTNQAGGWTLVDSYAPGFVTPVPDTRQDIKLVSLSYTPSNNTLHASWLRPLVPCDEQQDLPLAVGMPVHVIWAYGPSWAYHGPNRGGKLIKFAQDASTAAAGQMPGNSSHATDLLSTTSGASSNGDGDKDSTPKSSRGLLIDSNSTTDSGELEGHDANATQSPSTDVNSSDVRVLDLVYPVDIPAQETTYKVMYFKLPDDRCVTHLYGTAFSRAQCGLIPSKCYSHMCAPVTWGACCLVRAMFICASPLLLNLT
jgi:hypothetical protein